MRVPAIVAAVLGPVILLTASPAEADVLITVDKAAQRMIVTVNGEERHRWPVSTGMAGYATPAGSFAPSRLVREHYSREWDNAPMPHSIFFTDQGHAIHGSSATGRLGSRASHGCVRLAPANAAALFKLVQAEGLEATKIEITGSDPTWTAGRSSLGGDYSRLTSFDPLASGIMAGGLGPSRR
jgi:lipoprotein-anchoring transpeptidase ErfK/SrfK